MNKGSSAFYHSHITKNLQRVQKRTSDYIKHRKQFLQEYYQPLDEKISSLDEQIRHYQHLIQNQNQMIENQAQVKQLKGEIKEFLDTQKYFLQHLEQYQEKILTLTYENKFVKDKIHRIKQDIHEITSRNADRVYKQMGEQQRQDKLNHSNISYRQKQEMQSQKSYQNLLPTIFKVEKYYVNKQTSNIKNQMQQTGKKPNFDKFFTYDVAETHPMQDSNKSSHQSLLPYSPLPSTHKNTPQQNQLKSKQAYLRSKFKQITSSFNKSELLFKECFQKKKNQVQKSVSQLQSKLISNREKFLDMCEAIGDGNFKRIEFDDFQTLTGDQLMTLCISFPWLQKKIMKEFADRRREIVEMQVSRFI